jgi:hypothetical protein
MFPTLSIDRDQIHWEDYTQALTPVELINGRWYKREDKFAPLGYGGINGSKLRQLIHLTHKHAQNAAGIITGASVLSPQISMGALVAEHFGLPITVVLGATKPYTAVTHENVAIAARVGAEFIFTPVAFNPAIQRAVTNLLKEPEYANYYRLCYGITTPDDATPQDIYDFHNVGAPQTNNIPPEVEHLIIPSGSANSTVTILLGIAKNPPAGLKRITLMGIGPTRLQWVWDRLETIENLTGLKIRDLYTSLYHNHKELEHEHQHQGPIVLEHFDLHTTKFASYTDKMPFTIDGIELHPTYEGKVMTYLHQNRHQFAEWWEGHGNTMLWIVGNKPTRQAMVKHLPQMTA